MKLGRIVASESHLQYLCQVYSSHEVERVPAADDYGLGNYVSVPLDGERHLIGIICDTRLHNPDYGAYGPRLSAEEEMPVFSPDYVTETRTLVSIVAVGYLDAGGCPHQDAPPVAPLVNAEVHSLRDEDIRRFHEWGGEVKLGYLPLLVALARTASVMTQVILRVLSRLQEVFPEGPASIRLRVVRQNLSWQLRVQSMP